MTDIWEFRYGRLERLFALLSDPSTDYSGRFQSALRLAIEEFGTQFAGVGHPDRGLYVLDHFAVAPGIADDAFRTKWTHAASKHLDTVDRIAVCSNVPAQEYFKCEERSCGVGSFVAVRIEFGERKWLLMAGSLDARESNYTQSDKMLIEAMAAFFLRMLTLRESRNRIATKAYYDPLTRAVNRQGLTERCTAAIAAALRGNHRGALLFADLNGFKAVNDTYGHKAGDAVLLEFADRVRSVLRGEDLFARLGGDEFAILVPHVRTPRDIPELERRIATVLRPPFRVGSGMTQIGAAVGAAYFPEEGRTPADLLGAADVEMYKAKQTMKLAQHKPH